MNVLIVGAGSIGTRRARIVRELGHNVMVSDTDESRACALAAELGGMVTEPDAEADLALVCTPPATHALVTSQLSLETLAGLYVEKPMAMHPEDVDDIEALATLVPVTMGACNLRFMVPCSPPDVHGRNVRWVATMGQHSSYWSAEHQPVSMILDSIHDLDLLQWYAGPIIDINGWSDVERAQVTTKHEHGDVGLLRLDRIEDPPVRSLRAWKGTSYEWSCSLWPPDPEMYVREMDHLLHHVDYGTPTMNPIRAAAETCRLALEVA